MKKRIYKLLFAVSLIACLLIVLNIKVGVQQGINYQVHTIRVPLFLKILDFIDRHYNYQQLVRGIVDADDKEQKRAMKIFNWTYQNIRKAPKDFPIIDDHVWYIIVRGYGVRDQFSDVFTVLCNYAGLDAHYCWVYSRDHTQKFPFSFVKINKRWFLFDAYNGIYFQDKNDNLADIQTIKSGDYWRQVSLEGKPTIDYKDYIDTLPSLEDVGLRRANIQSPLKRLAFEVKKWIKQN